MLRITPVSAGTAGVDYLLGQSGCQHERAAAVEAPERDGDSTDYYLNAEGEPVGRWLGRGLEIVGAEAGQAVDEATVRAVFGRLEHPVTGEQLGRPPRKFKSPEQRLAAALAAEPNATPERRAELEWQIRKSQRQAVGYYDATFSPAKSVSVYYAALRAAGRYEDAEKVWNAHREAVGAAVDYLEREAGYSRAGYHGKTKDNRSVGEYVAARQWTAIRFDHTTNREGEPQLHSHVAILNRVQCEQDGEWRTMDGKALFGERAAASAIYDRNLIEAMQRDLPVRFAMRPDGKAREIVGIPQEWLDAFSTRRQQVVKQVQEWTRQYVEANGREPNVEVLADMMQAAALKTRAPKAAISPQEHEATWQSKGAERCGGRIADLVGMTEAEARPELGEVDRNAVIRAAVHEVQQTRAEWTQSHLRGFVEAQLPDQIAKLGPQYEALVSGLVEEALAPGNPYGVLTLTAPAPVEAPAALQRAEDGRFRFRPHRDERYATAEQLSAEDRLVAAARQTGAPALTAEQLVVAEAELIAAGLGDDQRAAVLGILGSGRHANVLIGPAGAGKSFTVSALAGTWEEYIGAPVMGLATSQIAANVLTEEGLPSVNLTVFLNEHDPEPGSGWETRHLERGALLVVDESNMSDTTQLDRVAKVAARDGAAVLFTGDWAQLSAVGAGGALKLLAQEVGAYELTGVRRFTAEWERDASLGVRAGDMEAVRAYDEHGRIVEGSKDEVTEAAVRAYLADTLAGRQSILVVDSNQEAADLSGRIRDELVRFGKVDGSRAVELRDGTVAGVGDLVQTRRNDRTLTSVAGRWVVNRDVWRVTDVTDTGGLRVQLVDRPGVEVTLPGGYLTEHATLAYASTVHAAEGRTIGNREVEGTAHFLIDPHSTTREAFYVGMTRARDRNTAYVPTSEGPNDERGNQPINTNRFAVLGDVLDRDTTQISATQALRDELEASRSMAALGPVWSSLVAEQARDRYADVLLDLVGPERMDALVAEDGAGRLWRAVRSAELAGHDPRQLLTSAVTGRELNTAASVSDVLRHRIHNLTGQTYGVPASWTERTPEVPGTVGQFLREWAQEMDDRQAELGEVAAAEPPAWALEHLGPVSDDPIARQEWTQRAGAVAAYREMYSVELPVALGPAPSREMPEARAAWDAAYEALGAPEEGRDYAAASDEALRAMRGEYEREQVWAPAYVADLLRETELRHARYERDATLARVEAQAATDAAERDRLARRADVRERLAEQMAQRVEKLETIHQARTAWFEHTEAARHRAERAEDELRHRHPEQAQAEQPEPEQTAAAVVAEQQAERERDRQAEPEQTVERPEADRDQAEVEQAEVEQRDVEQAQVEHDQAADVDQAEPTVAAEPSAQQATVEQAEVEVEADQPQAQVEQAQVSADQAAEVEAKPAAKPAQPQRISTEADLSAAVDRAKQAMQIIAERAEAEAAAEQARQQDAARESERQALEADRGFEIGH